MGFNKKFLSEESIKSRLEMGMKLEKIFHADCLIFTDEYSYNLYENYINNKWV